MSSRVSPPCAAQNRADAPRLRLLSDEKLLRIHEASLELLEDMGIKVTSKPVVRMMAEAGCTVAGEDIVKIPRDLVEDAISSAPKRVVIYDREGNEALFVGGMNAYFGMGITAIQFHDPETGVRRDPCVEDIALACRVGDALPNLDFIATPLVVKPTPGIPAEVVNQCGFRAMVSNTTKPLQVLTEDAEKMSDNLDIAEAIAGGPEALRERPFVVPIASIVSPFVYNADTLDKFLLAVDRGVPIRVGCAPMAGGTGPVTLAGTVTIANAECLGGLVICQIRRRGAPCIIGSVPTTLDMKSANISISPEGRLLSMAAIEMAHYYGLPVHGAGCRTGSMVTDQQAALEQMMTIYTAILAGLNFAPHTGFLEAGLSFSLEAVVMGDEMIGMARRIMRGMPVDDEALALDTIRAVGPGGNFLETEHTFRHYRREQWQPTLLCRTTYDSWVEGGSKLMGDRAKEKLTAIIRDHEVKPLPDAVQTQISEIIERRRAGRS